jgi:hypothetical protein
LGLAKLAPCNLDAFEVLTSTVISVVLVSSAIFLTLCQMRRQKQVSSVCTNWNHLQETNKVEMLHMLQTEASELSLRVFQYCQLSTPLQKEKNSYSFKIKTSLNMRALAEEMCVICSVTASKFSIRE